MYFGIFKAQGTCLVDKNVALLSLGKLTVLPKPSVGSERSLCGGRKEGKVKEGRGKEKRKRTEEMRENKQILGYGLDPLTC